jgi:prepilin-type N-terminal cleavage/methylation domain-containing protein
MPVRCRAAHARRGFTLLELVVVIAIGGILSSVAILAFSQVQGQLATRSALSNFLSLHAQARALAVERGGMSQFIVDEGEGEVRIEFGGVVVSELSLADEFAVTLDADGGLTHCFTPRGIADLGCTTFNTATNVTFTRGNRTATVQLLPLGQAREI